MIQIEVQPQLPATTTTTTSTTTTSINDTCNTWQSRFRDYF